MQNAHVSALQAKHADLDDRITSEKNRPLPDETLLHDLKKRKLMIKDEIRDMRIA